MAQGPTDAGTSVVIPTWNSSSTLPRALASIDDPAAEILVVDDMSDDAAGTRAIAAADPRVTLIAKPARSNAAHSRALGLERAGGDIVLFLDADDHFRPGHIARRRALHQRTGASVAIGRFRLNDGVREWDGPMAPYDGGDVEDYLFRGGDARSSTISVAKAALRGTSFDPALPKHQDWGFILAAGRNGESIAFDAEPGVVIDVGRPGRMSARSNVEASLAFASERLHGPANRRRFLIGRLRTSLRLGDQAAARRFRAALLALEPTPRERWGSAAMLVAARIGVAAPLHKLLTARR